MALSNFTPALVEDAPHERILAITAGFWQSRALSVAAELDLAELLASGPLHVDVLASRTKTHARNPVSFASCACSLERIFAGLAQCLRQYTG